MKHILSGVMIAASVCGAWAQEKEAAKDETKTKFGLTGTAYSTAYKAVGKSDRGSYSAVRLNPSVSASNGPLEGFLEFEYNSTFGEAAESGDLSENTGLGTGKMNLAVNQAFFKNKMSAIPSVSLTAGLAPFAFPLVWDDNAPLFGLSFAGDSFNVNAYYLKTYEGDNNKASDDAQVYIADASFSFGKSSVRPALFIVQSKKSADADVSVAGVKYRGRTGFLPGLSAHLEFGAFNIDAAGVLARGNGDDAYTTVTDAGGNESKELSGGKVKYSAYAFDIAPSIRLNDSFVLGAFFTGVSGDSNGTTDGKDSSFLNATLDGGDAGINSFRLFIVEDGGSFTTNSDVANAGKYSNTYGYNAAGLSLEASFGDLKTKLQSAYVVSAKKISGKSNKIGIETDLNIEYAVTKGTAFYLEGAFLKTGAFYTDHGFVEEKQNASYINAGMKYSL